MNYIKTVMELYPPDNWSTDFVYEHQRFILIDIQEESEEYRDVVEHFRSTGNGTPIGVQRVQHPFAYARFKIHKEALSMNGCSATETIEYERVKTTELNTYLDYSCDSRRKSYIQSIDTAVYVRKRVLSAVYYGDRDSRFMPEYVISIKKCSDGQASTSNLENFDLLFQRFCLFEL